MKVFDYTTYDYIVSIDFGTTFSGCSYIYTGGDEMKKAIEDNKYDIIMDKIRNVKAWKQGGSSVKVPTVAVYSRERKTLIEWGFEAHATWKGLNIPCMDEKEQEKKNSDIKQHKNIILQKFKLNLSNKTIKDEDNQDVLEDNDYFSIIATIDYLRNINETAIKEIIKASILPNFEQDKIRYVLTVPAQWSDDERAMMRIMAKDAGIITKSDHENKLIIINESFAATLFCEKELSAKKFNFKKGAKYLICDAGGGTVDLATYESTDTSHGPHKTTGRCQLTTDSGDTCGSGFVDDRMEALLLDILFHNVQDVELRARNKLILSTLMANFITELKPCFDVEEGSDTRFDLDLLSLENEEYTLKPQDDDDETLHEYSIIRSDEKNYETLIIPHEIMCEYVFDPVVNATLKLIENQIQKANSSEIQAIFLLGGFGDSKYLQKKANIRFKDKVKEIISCDHGDRAAMRGAIYFGIDGIQRAKHEKSIISYNLKDDDKDQEPFDILVCIDIGYEYSTCGYFINKGDKQSYLDMKLIGFEEDNNLSKSYHGDYYKFPTIIEYQKGIPKKWGPQVDLDIPGCVTLSHLMATSKDAFHKFIIDYLERIHEYTCRSIQKEHTYLSRVQFRYCLTMENCFNFFHNKKEMIEIAIAAKVIREEPNTPIPPNKLLLINREDASATFYEKIYYTENNSYFWKIKIDMDLNHCSVSCHEIRNVDNSVPQTVPTEEDLDDTERSNLLGDWNIPLDFGKHLIDSLKHFKLASHSSMHYGNFMRSSCNKKLEQVFKDLIETDDIMGKEGNTLIKISNDCCEYTCTLDQVVDLVVQPTIQDFVKQICKCIVDQEGIPQKFIVDNIYIIRKTSQSTHLKFMVVNSLCTDLDKELDAIFKGKCKIELCSSLNEPQVPQIASDYQPKIYPTINTKPPTKDYIKHFLQINFQRDCFHMNLHEATSITGENERVYQNVRKVKSSTFEFDLISALVKQLYNYISRNPIHYFCKNKISHKKHSQKYNEDLKKGLLNYIKQNLILKKNEATEPIYIDTCCTVNIKPHDCLVFILKPALTELLETMNMNMIQSGIVTRNYTSFHNIFIFGTLVETTKDVNNFLKKFLKDWIFDSLPGILGKKDDIIFTVCNSNEVINGAAMYGLDTTLYMERISRRTYAVSVQAHPISSDSEAETPLADTEQNVVLHFQSKKESSETNKIDPTTKIILINQNDRVTMDIQSTGTFERFFVDQDCIVYATIYLRQYSDQTMDQEMNEEDDEFKKIHQFEICLKREDSDTNNTSIRSRLNFEIRLLFPNKNEARFEANIGQSKENRIPKFEFRDEILVANI